MSIQILIFAIMGGLAVWMLLKPLTKRNKPTDFVIPSEPVETPTEVIKIDDPVPNDPEPTPMVIIPADDEGEMPIKPTPPNCQLAQFMPAPQEYYYIDCCGEPQSGMGYEEWEKRSPVKIDANEIFKGMVLIGESAEPEC